MDLTDAEKEAIYPWALFLKQKAAELRANYYNKIGGEISEDWLEAIDISNANRDAEEAHVALVASVREMQQEGLIDGSMVLYVFSQWFGIFDCCL